MNAPSSRPVLGATFEAVLFDMDGTVIDSTPSVRRSWLMWGAEHGLDPSFRDGGHGQPARDIVESLLSPDRVEAAFARIQEIEVREVGDITALPGAADALAAIPEGRKALVTSCTRPLADARIRASGILAPELVVTFDDVEIGKPGPDPYLNGARRLGANPVDCLVVEDATAGLAAGRAAGCATIAVTGTHTASELDADLIVSSLTEIRFHSSSAGITVEAVPAREETGPLAGSGRVRRLR